LPDILHNISHIIFLLKCPSKTQSISIDIFQGLGDLLELLILVNIPQYSCDLFITFNVAKIWKSLDEGKEFVGVGDISEFMTLQIEGINVGKLVEDFVIWESENISSIQIKIPDLGNVSFFEFLKVGIEMSKLYSPK